MRERLRSASERGRFGPQDPKNRAGGSASCLANQAYCRIIDV